MEITLAKSAGFCFGVKNAVDKVNSLLDSGCRVVTIGKLIHNPTMIRSLSQRGVAVLEQDDGIFGKLEEVAVKSDEEGDIYAVIRAHGIPPVIEDKLKELSGKHSGFHYVDCTCPRVKKVHEIVAKNSSPDTVTLIIGDISHPEVMGIAGWAKGEVIVLSPAETDEIHLAPLKYRKLVAVAQTTLNIIEWKNSQKNIEKYCTNANIFGTICNVTETRQTEAYKLSKNVDMMLVIGGKESSNTNKLYNIAAKGMADAAEQDEAMGLARRMRYTFLVESKDELPLELLTQNIKIGITAGASTPGGIIEEVLTTMAELESTISGETAEQSFADMLEDSLKNINNGDTVKGIITSVTPNEIHVDLGVKVTGIIPYSEINETATGKLEDTYHVGDEIEAIVVKVSDLDGVATLSRRRIENTLSWRKIQDAYNEGTILEGKYLDPVKGGCIMSIDGVRVFVPASHTGIPKDGDLATLTGTTARVKIIEINEQRRRAVASARQVLRDERKAKEAEFWANIEEGKEYDGVVKNLKDYGAFVDLGGVDGMVHSSELSWKRIKHPSEVVNVGDKIHVFVKSFDAEAHKISLGYKTEDTNPWTIFTSKYSVGDVASVKIVSMMAFGAFAEVVPGADGLIHISQIADHKVTKPADELEVGQVVDAKIIDIDNENHKISLSIRALLEDAGEEAESTDAE